MHKTVSSSIDKLDKVSWITIVEELKTKGLEEQQIDDIKRLFDERTTCPSVQEDYARLTAAWSAMGIDQIEYDPFLTRGLDYYTGIIFEVVLEGLSNAPGSVAAGGRYDGLIGSLVSNTKSCPAIGLSFGVSRLMTCLELPEDNVNQDLIFVVSIGQGQYCI